MAAAPSAPALPERARLLVIRLGAVGDVVRALAAVGLLRRERGDLWIGWLVERASSSLLEGNPALDEVFVFERRLGRDAGERPEHGKWLSGIASLRRRLRERGFDVALDLQGTLKSAAWAVASGAPRRVGFGRGQAREGSWLLMSERIRPPESARSRLQQFVSLVRGLGVSAQAPADGLPVPLPPLGPKREAVSRWCAERGLDRRPWVVLHPGSSPAQQFKRWPAPRFAEVGRRLLARSVGVAISWGPGEEALAREVEAGCGGGAALAPAGDLLDLAALIAAARAFVGNDTGPMHLSWAVGTPVVGLFGPTDPALNAPPGEAHRILYAGPPRRPGERRPRRPLYLEQIRPEEVEAAVLEVLERAGSARQGAAHWPGDLRELPTEPGR